MNPDNNTSGASSPLLNASSRWGVLILSFVVLLLIVGILAGSLSVAIPDERNRTLTVSVLQGALAFVLPCLLAWYATSRRPWKETGLSIPVSPRAWAWLFMLYILAYPAISQTVYWNENMTLPSGFAGLEQTWRQWEHNASETTMAVLNCGSVGGLIVDVLVVGVFTGFAEEMFFRAGIQKMMIRSGIPAVWAIWVSAFIFSVVHMQFFGFVPRLLLGAMFGYVYHRTGSVWSSAALHAVNNSLVAITSFMAGKGIISADIDSLLTEQSGFPVLFTISAVLTLLYIYSLRDLKISSTQTSNGRAD